MSSSSLAPPPHTLSVTSRTPPHSELAAFGGGQYAKDWPYSRPDTPTPHHPRQMGWIGLGSMGYHMARNLAESSDLPLFVFNRTVSKAEELAKEITLLGTKSSIVIAQTIGELVNACDVIFTNLANDGVVQSIYAQINDILEETPPHKPKIFVETSTVYPTLAGELDSAITKIRHCHFVSAPVFGPPPEAAKRQLVVVLAGEYNIKKEVAHLMIPAIGRKVIDMGGNVEKAQGLKLIGNAVILSQIEVAAEMMTLADKAGVGAGNLLDIMKELFPGSNSLVNYGKKILNDEFDGSNGFSLAGGLKDASHIRKLAADKNAVVPTVDAAHQHMITARALAASQQTSFRPPFEVLDWSSLASATRVAAGLPGFDSSKHGGVQLDSN